MPRQHKRKKKRPARERDLVYAEEGQLYAMVTKMLGNCRCDVRLQDGTTAVGTIRGRMRHRMWVRLNDLVLVSRRDFQDDKVDIIHAYNHSHARTILEVEQVQFHMEEKEDDEVLFEDI